MPNPNRASDKEPSRLARGRKVGSTGRQGGGDESVKPSHQEVFWEIGITIAVLLSIALVGHVLTITLDVP
jgi:hypothetical protein